MRSGVKNETVFRAAFGGRDSPRRCGSSDEHFARRSAGLAESIKRAADTAAAAGDLVAVFGIKIGLNDSHETPIAAKFFSYQHWKGGLHDLTHFGMSAPDGDHSGG